MPMNATQVLVPSKGYMWQCARCGELFHMRFEIEKHANMWLKNCPGRNYW